MNLSFIDNVLDVATRYAFTAIRKRMDHRVPAEVWKRLGRHTAAVTRRGEKLGTFSPEYIC